MNINIHKFVVVRYLYSLEGVNEVLVDSSLRLDLSVIVLSYCT